MMTSVIISQKPDACDVDIALDFKKLLDILKEDEGLLVGENDG